MKKLFVFLAGFLMMFSFMAGQAAFAAQDQQSNLAVSEKLDLVLQKLDEIKVELEVVKIRASVR